jgi:hypothetical protein
MEVTNEHGRTTLVTFIIFDCEWKFPDWTYSLTNATDGTLHNRGKKYAESKLELSSS